MLVSANKMARMPRAHTMLWQYLQSNLYTGLRGLKGAALLLLDRLCCWLFIMCCWPLFMLLIKERVKNAVKEKEQGLLLQYIYIYILPNSEQ